MHLDLTLPPISDRLEGPFSDWLLSVRERRLQAGRDGLVAAAGDGVTRSLAAGTTLVVDYDAKDRWRPGCLRVVGDAARNILRAL